jgi:hypothetical protein
MSVSLKFLAMVEREASQSFQALLASPHFEVKPRRSGGQRPGFEGENTQEKPWETHVHIHLIAVFEASNNPYVRTIHRILFLPLQQAEAPLQFEKGGYCKKIRGCI